jgi:hypothetical protein
MTKLLRKYYSQLETLNECSSCEKAHFLKNCSNDFIYCLCEISNNLLIGNIPVDNRRRDKLYHFRHTLRRLARKDVPLNLKRRKLVQEGGALLPLLLPPLLTIAAELLTSLYPK